MRTLVALGLSLTFATFSAASARADAPSRFQVPERDTDARPELREAVATDAPTHELVLLADVIARPGETPAEALSRALHGPATARSDEQARHTRR